jgi:hypothetical protein
VAAWVQFFDIKRIQRNITTFDTGRIKVLTSLEGVRARLALNIRMVRMQRPARTPSSLRSLQQGEFYGDLRALTANTN